MTAREKLKGILGDFPYGFNIGATAGAPGFAGDLAYQADAIGRWLAEREQIAPESYPGTTEYISTKAGFAPPKSISGMLGMAVGGMLSPTPMDLLKFSPVLSAIPFWHGSPHKYDAVDLSKIGTGEGAQAYGWGYYGAESPEVAKEYATKLAQANPHGALIKGEVHFEVRPVDAAGRNYEVVKWIGSQSGDAEYNGVVGAGFQSPDEAEKFLVAQGLVPPKHASKWDDLAETTLISENTDQLYKGEYRWPDPAKEAATPLRGEDLLDWDKPLSEQPKIVEKLRGLNDRFIDELLADRLAGVSNRNAGLLPRGGGEDFYKALSVNATAAKEHGISTILNRPGKNGDEQVSEVLKSAGIPGIRYLDQMSRGEGKGTYNYVMFDDTGIELLERNGQPIKKGMLIGYHKTNADFDEFDAGKIGEHDPGYAGRGVYFTPRPLEGRTYGDDVVEAELSISNPYRRTKDNWQTDPLNPYNWIPKRVEELGWSPENRKRASQEWTEMMQGFGYDSFIDEAVENGEIVVFDPKKAKIISRKKGMLNGNP